MKKKLFLGTVDCLVIHAAHLPQLVPLAATSGSLAAMKGAAASMQVELLPRVLNCNGTSYESVTGKVVGTNNGNEAWTLLCHTTVVIAVRYKHIK